MSAGSPVRSRGWRKVLTLLGPALITALLSISSLAHSGPRVFQSFPDSGTVTGVSDGDSLRIVFADGVERRVRLIGVDAPELDLSDGEAFRGFLAKRFAFFHLFRRAVRLEYDEERVDAFGRVLAYARTGDGVLFNELIIREGYARALLRYPFRTDYRVLFERAEAEARKAGRGLWQTAQPEVIPASEAPAHLGRLIRVRFLCSDIAERRGFLVLGSGESVFEAVVPRDRRRAFPRLADCPGRTLVVSGFLETFGGRPQIMVSFPSQLERE